MDPNPYKRTSVPEIHLHQLSIFTYNVQHKADVQKSSALTVEMKLSEELSFHLGTRNT